MDRNFISVFRSIPLWPNDLIPLDEILHRLAKVLNLDTSSFDPLQFIGGVLGFRDIKIHRFDGVTTVTGDITVAIELVLAPFQSYVGFVIGEPGGGVTTFPFSVRIKDEPPIKNNDEVFESEENPLDPQLAAFQPVEKNPEAGFFDVESWRVSLRNIPAKIRILKGVTRVGCRAAYEQALINARHYVYLEDQYFVEPDFVALLIGRLPHADPKHRLRFLKIPITSCSR